MITLDNVVILATIHQMILDLKADLISKEINLIKDIRYNENKKDVQITCPVHKGGQESHPSCGISTKEVIRNGKSYPAGTVYCFNCGYTSDFFTFVSYCFGTTNRDIGKRYILQKYNSMDSGQRPNIELNYQRVESNYKYTYLDESVLDSYRYTSDYLFTRKLDLNTILFYELGYNPFNNAITIPVRDHKGRLIFIKQRFVNPPPGVDKYLNEKGIPKQSLLYGFDKVLNLISAINSGSCTNKKLEENYKRYGVFLVEGEFNAVYLMQQGYPAVSLLGRILFEDTTKRTVQQKELLLKNGITKLVIWTDYDIPGIEAQNKIIKQTYKDFIVRIPEQDKFPQYNDANDFPKDELDTINFFGV